MEKVQIEQMIKSAQESTEQDEWVLNALHENRITRTGIIKTINNRRMAWTLNQEYGIGTLEGNTVNIDAVTTAELRTAVIKEIKERIELNKRLIVELEKQIQPT